MEEEEIDLREYINVLMKRKGIIILIFLVSVIAAILVSYFVLIPVYQSSTTFAVALVDDSPVLNISESLEIMSSNLILDEVIKEMNLNISASALKSRIKAENLKGTSFIKVTAEANLPEEAKELVENTIEVFIKQNQSEYKEKIKLVEDALKISGLQVAEFEKSTEEIKNIKKKITTSEELSEAERQFQTSLLLSSSVTERDLYNNLTEQIYTLQEKLNNCQDFRVINYAQLPTAPIKPRKELNIVIAGVLGLFVGIFVVFFMEFWQKGK